MSKNYVLVGIAGASDKQPLPKAVDKARKFAQRISMYRDHVKLLSGGDGGLMKIVSEEFVKRGGETIGFIPLEDENRLPTDPRYNPYNTIRILTGLTLQVRSIMLVRSSHSFVVLGGGAGTIIEAYLAYLYSIPLIILVGTGYPTDNLEKMCIDGYLDHRKIIKPLFVEDAEEAADLAYRLGSEKVGLLNV
ncbi:MAG: TIGR00725 family protein [Nitrososphaerota archaeon]|nr:TIGR00725 family protein [Nitrososphaerota archaeon]